MFSMEERKINFEGLSDEEVKKFVPVLKDFMQAYADKDKNIDDKEWLKRKLKEELPELTEEEVEGCSEDIITGVKKVDENIESIEKAHTKGIKSDEWLLDKLSDASIGMGINGFGDYLSDVDRTLENANAQLLRTVLNQDGSISYCQNLDGFIAEQMHVNTFNEQAALNLSPYVAKVQVPEPGTVYGRNSFDAVICDKYTGKIVHQYQFKYGSDAKATIAMLKNGNYNNQTIIVPKGQVEEVQAAFPGKTVTDHIGNTAKVTVGSQPMSKEDVKAFPNNVQEKSMVRKDSWNSFETKKLIKGIAVTSAGIGVISAGITAGFEIASKAFKGEKIEGEEVIKTALVSGADAGIKCAAAGALTVAVRKGTITVLSKSTPAGVIAGMVAVSIENVKIAAKVAAGELTVKEGLDRMARTSVAMTYGLGWSVTGSLMGAAALSFIPVVGPFLGAVVGGGVAYCAGAKFGNMVYDSAKKIATVAKNVVKSVCNGVKNTTSSICTGIKNFFTW